MAGVQETFMTYEIYDDAITLRLVQEACKMLGKYHFVRCTVGKIIIWSPADFLHLPTDKEMMSDFNGRFILTVRDSIVSKKSRKKLFAF